MHKGAFKPLTAEEERTGKLIVNAAYMVHKALAPGLLERVYEVCFCHVLTKDGCIIKRQLDIPIVFDNIVFNEGLRIRCFGKRFSYL